MSCLPRPAALALAVLVPFAAATASAKTCDLAIAANDQMQFDQPELKVAADCTEVALTLRHTGKLDARAMGHNWVLTPAKAVRGVALDGMNAGAADGYVKPGDDRVIARTAVIGGGETTRVTFPTARLAKGGDYAFFCSFPGHWNVMRGKLTFG